MTKIRRNLPNNQYLAALLANSPSTSNVFATIADLAGLGGGTVGSTNKVQHDVKYAQQINKGQAVYVSSADGTNMIVSKADNATEATSSKVLGLVTTTGNTNHQGIVVTEGLLEGLDTSTATIGDAVWLGTNGNLIFWHYGLTTKPVAPAHLVFIGIVTRVNANNGEIFIKPQNGFEMDELHDVSVVGRANNMVLGYNSSTSLHEFKTINTWLGFTPVDNTFTIATSGPLSGASDLSGIGMTLSITQATASTAGYLSSADWNTFNNKVATIRTISTSSPLTGGGDLSADRTLSIPKATTAIDGYLSAADWTIFNGKQAALGYTPANIAGATFTGDIYATNLLGINTGDETITTIKTKLGAASGSQDGYLTSTDWNAFSNKLSGTGTANKIIKWSSTSGVTDSNISDDGAGNTTFTSATNDLRIFLKAPAGGVANVIAFLKNNINTFVIGVDSSSNYIINSYNSSTGSFLGNAFTVTSNTLNVTLGSLAGSGTRMVTVNAAGLLSTQSISSGSVTSVTGTAPIVSSGGATPAISIPGATTSVDGYLSAIDWTTFNAKQNAITLTTTGTSGAATFDGTTLNIPQYAGGSVASGFDYGQAYAANTMTFL